MSATWEEIKRLAADFQRVQLAESTYKLSERDCINLVTKLAELKMLDLIYTLDGKEYLTDKQVVKEIYDELYVHEGRVNIVELQTLLNIDLSHIEGRVSEIVKSDPNLVLTLGQVISKDYLNKISEEINDLLQEKGSVFISELTSMYELPMDFIQQMLSYRIGTIIKGHLSEKMLYTENYINLQKAKLAGALEATIKPVRVSQLIKDYDLDLNMIFDILDELINLKQIDGIIFGGRQEMSVYVPTIYTQAQKIYMESFFRQNGYIEFAALKRIGITDPEKYCKEHIKGSSDIKYLSSCCLASYLIDQIESNIEEALTATGYCEMASTVPSIVNEKDTGALAKEFSKKLQQFQTVIIADTIILNKDFIKKLLDSFQSDMEAKALEDLTKPKLLVALKTNNVTIGSGSSSQQQTTSTASASKGKAKGKKATSAQAESKLEAADDAAVEISYINETTLEKELTKKHKDLPDQLVEALIEYLLRPLNQQYLEVLRVQLEKSTAVSSDNSSKTSSGKNTIKDVQERLKTMILNARVFDKAAKTFPNEKGQDQLNKHLIKTICSDMANELFKYIATEQVINFAEENFNVDTRNKILHRLKEPVKQKLSELNQALNTKTTSEIVDMIEVISSEVLELQIKKSDQKREKEILLQLRETTKASLETETDAATILHQSSILLYYAVNNVILNAPGRFVPMILDALKSNLTPDSHKKLTDFQSKVIESLQKAKNEEQSFDAELINEIKSIGLNAKSHLKS